MEIVVFIIAVVVGYFVFIKLVPKFKIIDEQKDHIEWLELHNKRTPPYKPKRKRKYRYRKKAYYN